MVRATAGITIESKNQNTRASKGIRIETKITHRNKRKRNKNKNNKENKIKS